MREPRPTERQRERHGRSCHEYLIRLLRIGKGRDTSLMFSQWLAPELWDVSASIGGEPLSKLAPLFPLASCPSNTSDRQWRVGCGIIQVAPDDRRWFSDRKGGKRAPALVAPSSGPIYKISPKFLLNIFKMSPNYHQNITLIFPEVFFFKYLQNILKIFPKYHQNITLIFPKYHQNITLIFPEYHQNITLIFPELSTKYLQNIAEIFSKFLWNILRPRSEATGSRAGDETGGRGGDETGGRAGVDRGGIFGLSEVNQMRVKVASFIRNWRRMRSDGF